MQVKHFGDGALLTMIEKKTYNFTWLAQDNKTIRSFLNISLQGYHIHKRLIHNDENIHMHIPFDN